MFLLDLLIFAICILVPEPETLQHGISIWIPLLFCSDSNSASSVGIQISGPVRQKDLVLYIFPLPDFFSEKTAFDCEGSSTILTDWMSESVIYKDELAT
jgi:hypothetical protein